MKKKSILICLLTAMAYCAFAQPKIKSAEYFWDTDPGEGRGHTIVTGTAADSVHFQATIPTTGLAKGFHALYMRVYSDSLKWSLTEQNNIFIYQNFSPVASDITAAEYFWDTAPAEGAGNTVAVNTAADSVHLTASIPVAGLTKGFHALYVRTKSATGNWGITEQQTVYVYTNFSPVAPNITAAEYFWDTDPGEGKGHSVTVNPQADSVRLLTTIPVSGINSGFHSLYFRTKSATGSWGITEQQEVYVYTNFSPVAPNITAAEYFWDADPGEGNGKSIAVGNPPDSVQAKSVIPVTGSAGFHELYVRTKDALNRWGITEQQVVYITSYVAKQDSIINAAEYFIDTDPGEGKATPITVSVPGDTIKQAFTLHIPTTTDTGYHLVYVRTRTSHGLWGVTESAQIHVGPVGLPISLLYFSAAMKGASVVLNWETTTEINSSLFQVQRMDVNGAFVTITSVPAAGNSTIPLYYKTTDADPPSGALYYRLKEVDKDGRVTYSMIVKLDNNAIARPKLYPNPARFTTHIDLPLAANIKTITIYNNLGQQVLQKGIADGATGIDVDVSKLAAGGYYVVLISKDGSRNTISFTRL